MAGSQPAAETSNGKAVIPSGDRLRRFFVLGGFIVGGAVAACSSPVPPPAAAPVAAAAIPTPSEPPPAPAGPAAMRVPELPVLTGMDPAQVIALLGEPDWRRPEPPAELWQYRNADCVLDVFLYAEAGRYRVLGSATRDRHVAPPVVASCTAAFGRRDGASRL
ncbi:MAG TPA: hypothetical protein VF113_16465 [Stellaceae bacterium]